jgi:TolA-binding protein
MDRQHRHDLKHDKFVDEVGALSVRARENQRVLLLIAVGLIGIAALTYGFFFYRSNKESKAQNVLATAIETIEAPVTATPQPNQRGLSFKTEAERTAAAEKLFKDVQTNYSGTDAADVAGLYLARMAAGRGDVDVARKNYEAFIDDHDDHVLTAGARYSLYQLRIDKGEAAQVITELEAELNKPEPVLPGDAVLSLLAYAYESSGNADKARDTYRRLSTDYPDSAYALEATRRAGQA